VQNLGDEPLCFLEMFRSPRFIDISLNQWMALSIAPSISIGDGEPSASAAGRSP
jgi:oxalate decarboxylase